MCSFYFSSSKFLSPTFVSLSFVLYFFLSLSPLPSLSHLLYSGASDKTIKVWSVKTLLMGASFVAHEDPVCTLAASSTMLFSGSIRSIKVSNGVPPPVGFPSLPPQVWDPTTRELLKTLPSQNHWVRALVTSDHYLYSGSYKSVKVEKKQKPLCVD